MLSQRPVQLRLDLEALLCRTCPEQLLGLGGGDRGGPGQHPRVAVEVEGVLGKVVGEVLFRQGAVGQSADEVQAVDGVEVRPGVLPEGRGELPRPDSAGTARRRPGRVRCCTWWKWWTGPLPGPDVQALRTRGAHPAARA